MHLPSNFGSDTKLSEFLLEHYKSMDVSERLFARVTTFHGVGFSSAENSAGSPVVEDATSTQSYE